MPARIGHVESAMAPRRPGRSLYALPEAVVIIDAAEAGLPAACHDMTTSLTVLRSVVVIDASAIAMYGIGTGLDPDGSISLAAAIVAARAFRSCWSSEDRVEPSSLLHPRHRRPHNRPNGNPVPIQWPFA